MIFANDADGKKTYIDDALRNKDYYCPLCEEKLVCKFGKIRTHHFAHQAGTECRDSWHYDMSEWHNTWQSYFPKENQEVVFSNGKEKHRADVVIGNTILEFQHSNISADEFYERNAFYHSIGKKIIWVFDADSVLDYSPDIFEYKDNIECNNVYGLKTNSYIFTEKIYRKSADLIFLCDSDLDGYAEDERKGKNFTLVQPSWYWVRDNKRNQEIIFGADGYYWDTEFVETILRGIKTQKDIGTIPYLWRKNHIKHEAIFVDDDGYKVKIIGNPIDAYEKYGRLYGFYTTPKSNHFGRQSKQVWGMKDWRLISSDKAISISS